MKTILYTLMISASLVGAAAHADQGNNYGADFPPPGISTTHELSRAQVKAELQQAKANGGIVYDQELPAGPFFADRGAASTSTVSRDEVRQEARQAAREDQTGEYPFGRG